MEHSSLCRQLSCSPPRVKWNIVQNNKPNKIHRHLSFDKLFFKGGG